MKGETIEKGKLMIRFNVEIFSSLGSKVAGFTATEATKADAEEYVEKWIAANYPKGRFTYKIS